jgi:thiamine kinase-like enzyme
MKHRLSILRSENNDAKIPMNYLKACRSARHRLCTKQKQQQLLQHSSPPERQSSSSSSSSSSLGGMVTSINRTSSPLLLSLSGPKGYAQARIEANETLTNNNNCIVQSTSIATDTALLFVRTVDNRPYFPLLKVNDPTNEESILEIANVIVSHRNLDIANTIGLTNSGSIQNCSNNSYNDSTNTTNTSHHGKGTIVKVTGGLTNALYKVDLPTNATSLSSPLDHQQQHSFLVRIFGAEGMIDRDEETTNFARLCHHNIQDCDGSLSSSSSIVHDQLDIVGRFANGRVETWIPNMRPAHHITDFGKVGLVLEMARQFARLHYGYTPPPAAATATTTSATISNGDAHGATDSMTMIHRPTLWNVINSWIDDLTHKLSHETFQKNDSQLLMEVFVPAIIPNFQRCKPPLATTEITDSSSHSSIIASYLLEEVNWLKNQVEMNFPNAAVVFCHNDVNAANVLLNTFIRDNGNDVDGSAYNKESVCIIDYEYGAMNYAMYDIANFMCEHCGGNDTGCPNYELLPSSERQTMFLREYIRERERIHGMIHRNKTDSFERFVVNATSAAEEAEVAKLLAQVEMFQMASSLLWGVWGVLQASGEVIEGTFRLNNDGSSSGMLTTWDNLRYGKNRLARYRYCKEVQSMTNTVHAIL